MFAPIARQTADRRWLASWDFMGFELRSRGGTLTGRRNQQAIRQLDQPGPLAGCAFTSIFWGGCLL